MKFTISFVLVALTTLAAAATPQPPLRLLARQNNGRPVPNGQCCVEAGNLKQDVCNVNGQTGRCVPSPVNGCGTRLTCIEDDRLNCDQNTLERGRPRCRLRGEESIA